MLSPQIPPEYIPLPATKVGGDHGMRIPKHKPTKQAHSPPPITQFASGMQPPSPTFTNIDAEPKVEKVKGPNVTYSQLPTTSESHKNQSRPLNQPR